MKKIVMSLLTVVLVMLSGCDTTKDIQSAYNLKNCVYKYKSITNLKVADMDISENISAVDALKLLAVFNGSASSIPLDFTLNMDIYNPNSSEAAFQGLEYMVSIDNIDFTSGSITEPFRVGPDKTELLSVHIGTDLRKLIAENSQEAIIKIVKNFVGLGNNQSQVTVRLKPTFNIGGSMIASPVYIPVNFTVGGK